MKSTQQRLNPLRSASIGFLLVGVLIPLPAAVLAALEMVHTAMNESLFRDAAAYFALCVLLMLFLTLVSITCALLSIRPVEHPENRDVPATANPTT